MDGLDANLNGEKLKKTSVPMSYPLSLPYPNYMYLTRDFKQHCLTHHADKNIMKNQGIEILSVMQEKDRQSNSK
jgi:hypothetical protein